MKKAFIARSVLLLALVAGTFGCGRTDATDEKASLARQVDPIFARWDRPDSPGCVCAIVKDGEIVLERSYGMADLEHGEHLSPQSVFYLASIAKQFTAASIALLSLDGKLSLDDDIRRYLPEMAAMAKPITIRHLVHHTSGLRDYFWLLGLTGWKESDYLNNDRVVKLLARQRTLNFEPGSRYAYSNSNYILLAEIVSRVSGQSLRRFAEERIFRPLGMTHTHFDDDYRQIVPHRVISYARDDGTWRPFLKEFDAYGDGNLLSTAEDLARWNENFTTGQVGGKPFLDLIQTRGRTNDGKAIDYAFGLFHGSYRGLATIYHAGGFKGFRTMMLRFPNQKVTVIVLGNEIAEDPFTLADQMADVVLAREFPLAQPPHPAMATTINRPSVKIDPRQFDACVGDYEIRGASGVVLSISHEGEHYFCQVTGQSRTEIFPSSENRFFLRTADVQITFHRENGGRVVRLTLHQEGEHEADRVEVRSLPASELAAYVGTYTSEELEATYRLVLEAGALMAKRPSLPPMVLRPSGRDRFYAHELRLEFVRGANETITGFSVSATVDRGIRFERQ